MAAIHINEITDEAIAKRIAQAYSASVEWTGRMPANTQWWDETAADVLDRLTIADVRNALQCDLVGESAAEEIDMAISIAAEPSELPDNACVSVGYK